MSQPSTLPNHPPKTFFPSHQYQQHRYHASPPQQQQQYRPQQYMKRYSSSPASSPAPTPTKDLPHPPAPNKSHSFVDVCDVVPSTTRSSAASPSRTARAQHVSERGTKTSESSPEVFGASAVGISTVNIQSVSISPHAAQLDTRVSVSASYDTAVHVHVGLPLSSSPGPYPSSHAHEGSRSNDAEMSFRVESAASINSSYTASTDVTNSRFNTSTDAYTTNTREQRSIEMQRTEGPRQRQQPTKRGLETSPSSSPSRRAYATTKDGAKDGATNETVSSRELRQDTLPNRLRRVLSPTKSAPASLMVVDKPCDPRDDISLARSSSVDLRSVQQHPPRYAYNASSPEEEAHRARLAEACEGLSSLCSQWHGSDYNRLKWGARGAPIAYCPLTIIAPQHVATIMSQQAMYESRLFASSEKETIRTDTASSGEESVERVTTSVVSSRATTVSDGEDIKTPGNGASDGWTCDSPVKIASPASSELAQETSPSSSIVLVSLQREQKMTTAAAATSKVLDLHVDLPQPSGQEQEAYAATEQQSAPGSPMQVDAHPPPPPPPKRSTSADVVSGLREAMESALCEHSANDSCVGLSVQASGGRTPLNEVKTSNTHPINISFFLPPNMLPSLWDLISAADYTATHNNLSTRRPLLIPSRADIFSMILADTSTVAGQTPPTLPVGAIPQGSRTDRSLGNLLLSSCPGKKVRLDGPVRGRGAICRDLDADLERVKGMGVACIICCLDDNELRFLGAPWEDYKKSASQVGLDVVRIPMPEGLTPASLVAFDELVEKVIRKYTLNGLSVLAHCRGGIGRAGLTACAWAVKLGIVSPSPDLEAQLRDLARDGGADGGLSPVERENARVMSTVERVIHLIRRRRSVKAIETFEQVNFLATYVAWLRKQSGQAEQAEQMLRS